MKCRRGYSLFVGKNAAGYYVGTFSAEKGPNCRASKYYSREIDAKIAMENGIFFRDCAENRAKCGYAACVKTHK